MVCSSILAKAWFYLTGNRHDRQKRQDGNIMTGQSYIMGLLGQGKTDKTSRKLYDRQNRQDKYVMTGVIGTIGTFRQEEQTV
jgi:hypothetical protein